MMFIVSQLMTSKEKNDLKEIFTTLDKNGDGMLTQEELLEGYTKFYKSEERAKAEVKYLMENADSDNNGTIDYSEFLMAMANKKNLLSKENVKRAFDLFDTVVLGLRVGLERVHIGGRDKDDTGEGKAVFGGDVEGDNIAGGHE